VVSKLKAVLEIGRYTISELLFVPEFHTGTYQYIRGSSVNIVSGYGLDDRGSIPGRGKGFFL
jgi:hypothetical protein